MMTLMKQDASRDSNNSDLARISAFSKQLRKTQRQLRILSQLRWAPEFEQRFLSQVKRPAKTSVYYRYPKIIDKHAASAISRSIGHLREGNLKSIRPLSRDCNMIFDRMISDFEHTHALRSKIGREGFGDVSSVLYGSMDKGNRRLSAPVLKVAKSFSNTLSAMGDEQIDAMYPKVLSADGLASILRAKLRESHLIQDVEIRVSDDVTADAAAAAYFVKLKKSAKFSLRDADCLLYHEIYTHIATSLNGKAQRHAKWLGFDTPRCTTTQEGLAVFMEVIAGKTYPRRLRKIVDRIMLLKMIAEGDNCGHLYDWLRERGYSHKDSMPLIIRAHRGMEPGGTAPFTKDLTYLQGLIEVFNFVKVNLEKSKYEKIQNLYCGKLSLSEMGAVSRLREQGIVDAPKWIPTQLLDFDSLVTWFSCTLALGSLDDHTLQTNFSQN